MTALLSILHNIVWPINLAVHMIVQSPVYFALMNQRQRIGVVKRWARSSHWLARVLLHEEVEVLGREHIPQGAALVASKHQSNWDFYSVYEQLPDSAFVLKEELMKIPFFGWYVAANGHIPIRRGDKGVAMRRMTKRAAKELEKNRQIVIFPEGHRMAPETAPNYRYGITRMYLDLGVPVVPVALSSGLYWPRDTFRRHPGTMRMMFMEPIQPGLDGKAFAALLERTIEDGAGPALRHDTGRRRPATGSRRGSRKVRRKRQGWRKARARLILFL